MKMGWEEFIVSGIIIFILFLIYDCVKVIQGYLQNILDILKTPRHENED